MDIGVHYLKVVKRFQYYTEEVKRGLKQKLVVKAAAVTSDKNSYGEEPT